jgi:hypothetical protein
MQFGGETGAVSIGLGGGQSFAQLEYLLFASTTPAYLRSTAGCGHVELLE